MKKPRMAMNPMKHGMAAALILSLSPPAAEAQSEWFQRRSKEFETVLQIEDQSQRIEAIAGFLGLARNIDPTGEQLALLHRAQQMLLETPGYARHFQDKFEEARRRCLNKEINLDAYSGEQESITLLGFIRGPDSVAVLGHFLNDPEGRNGKNIAGGPIWNGDSGCSINCELASAALDKIGIEHPPKVIGPRDFEQVEAWREWWDEVKAGKRTYRFVGSKVEYGPDGPVAAVEGSKSRDHSGKVGYISGAASSEAEASQSSRAWMYGIAAALLAVISWAGWKVARRGSS